MKKTKILVPAMGMLLLSTAASITGTVAWFAANASVTATGMEIRAKSDTTYLLISKTNNTASAIQAENSGEGYKSVDFAMTENDSKVYPSAPVSNATEAGYLNTTTGKKVGDTAITTAGAIINSEATASAVTNWYTASALTAAASDIDTASVRQLVSFDNYVVIKTVYLTVAAGANPANLLTVTPTFAKLDNTGVDLTAVKMIVTTDDAGFTTLSSANNGNAIDIKGDNHTLDSTHVRTVKMYLYYDGNDTNVYTNNMALLKGVSVEVSFGVTAGEGTANS